MKLTKDIRFFQEISSKHGEKVHLKCCKYMLKEKFQQDQIEMNYSLKLGDAGNHFYIILRGIITLKCRIFDERTHEFIEKIIGEMQTGEAFGELAILENRNRAATVICKSKCLFASLNKIDYQNILGFFLS